MLLTEFYELTGGKDFVTVDKTCEGYRVGTSEEDPSWWVCLQLAAKIRQCRDVESYTYLATCLALLRAKSLGG